MKRAIAVLALIILIITLIPINTAEALQGNAIVSATDFAEMSPWGSYYLDEDIVISSPYAQQFFGTIDGNGHTVTVSCPMFNLFDGIIKNITVNGEIISSNGMPTAGIAVRTVKGMYAENVTTNVNITLSGQNRGMYAAGILATDNITDVDNAEYWSWTQPLNEINAYSTFINCKNNGNITIIASLPLDSLGVTAENIKPRAGGIAGIVQGVCCINCENTGDISIPLIDLEVSGDYVINRNVTSSIAGGLIARTALMASSNSAAFFECSNSGNVTAYADAGGIVAYCGVSGNYGEYLLYACVNDGDITAPNKAGGFVGYVYGQGYSQYLRMEFCLNTGNVYYGDTDGANYGSPFIAYTNSLATVIRANISTGRVYEIGNGYNAFSHSFIGCSNVDPIRYDCSYNTVYDPDGHIIMFSMCDYSEYETNYINRHSIDEGINNGAINILNSLDDVYSGRIAALINSGYTSDFGNHHRGTYYLGSYSDSYSSLVIDGTYIYEYKWHQPEGCTLPYAYNSFDASEITLDFRADILFGDANGDNMVSVKDLVLLRQYLANYDENTGLSTVSVAPGADTNYDGKINLTDVIRLRRYLTTMDPITDQSRTILGHVHSYSTKWTYTDSQHWRACSCGLKEYKDEHVFGEWTAVTEATEQAEGSEECVCTVCKFKKTRIIPVIVP